MAPTSAVVAGLHYATGDPIQIRMSNGVIERIETWDEMGATHCSNDQLPWIGPGFVDLQINGYAGIDFNQPSLHPDDVIKATESLLAQGTTTYFPTVITNSSRHIESIVRAIDHACRRDRWTALSIAGIHLEGPFISPHDGPRGAHNREQVSAPDWEQFQNWQQAAGGRIRLITLSPEWKEAPEFIAKCVRSGVAVSIGHTAATPDQIGRAVQSGATMSTHLGNGAHLQLPRHPNYIWEQLSQDRLSASIIADGFHLPDSFMKVLLKVKEKQLFLVSDAVYLAGLEPGNYNTHIGGRVVLTQEGRLHLANEPELLAGSSQLLNAGIEHLAKSGLCALSTAWEMASILPASFMDLESGKGLAQGAPADLTMFSWTDNSRLVVQNVYKHGERFR